MGDENAPARAFDVSGWCHERERRWATYGAQAAHDPWPQTHVFLRDDESCSLWVAARGSGGGSRQATFRNELEERLEAGWRACRRAGWHREPTHALREFEGAVQQAFLSATEPSFAHHFGATWAAALTRGRRCALVSLGACRGFLVRGGLATQLTTDRTLYTASLAAGAPQLFGKDISLGALGAMGTENDPKAFRGQLTAFDWNAGDRLALVTGLHPDLVTEGVVAKALEREDDAEVLSRRLYEALLADARTAFERDRAQSWCSEREVLRGGAVVVARAR